MTDYINKVAIQEDSSSILKELDLAYIFQIDKEGDLFEITERRDQWNVAILTKKQMLQLAFEIAELATN
jgi:hypothetical protein